MSSSSVETKKSIEQSEVQTNSDPFVFPITKEHYDYLMALNNSPFELPRTLFSFVDVCHTEENKENSEILMCLNSNELDLNKEYDSRHVAGRKVKPLDWVVGTTSDICFLLLPKLLAAGASPFTFPKGADEWYTHPLKSVCCSYGNYRGKQNEFIEPHIADERFRTLLAYGAGFITPKERTPQNHCPLSYLGMLGDRSIVFENCLQQNNWLYTVTDLREMLALFDQFKTEDLKRIDLVCRFVLNAKELNIFSEGVVETFENYRKMRIEPLIFSAELLKTTHMLPSPIVSLVMEYAPVSKSLITLPSSGR